MRYILFSLAPPYPHSMLSCKTAFPLWKRTFTCTTLNGGTGATEINWETLEKSMQKMKSFFDIFYIYHIYHDILIFKKKLLIFCIDRISAPSLQLSVAMPHKRLPLWKTHISWKFIRDKIDLFDNCNFWGVYFSPYGPVFFVYSFCHWFFTFFRQKTFFCILTNFHDFCLFSLPRLHFLQ